MAKRFFRASQKLRENGNSQRERAGRCKEYSGKINVKAQTQTAYDGEE